ncbi:MAG TPA: START domain-containing protein [Solimonas sp.]|nr:START domain-containing protein [Solimonas sp.]
MNMIRLRALLAVLMLAMFAPLAQGADEGWKLEKDKDGIQVYTRAVEGWTIREIRGVTRVPARLSSVVAVIDDVAAASELSDMVRETAIHQRQTNTRYQLYSVIKMPWPLDDRDMLNQREIRQDSGTLVVTISNVALANVVPPMADRVRITRSRQQWLLTPEREGRVLVEMRSLTDPAGPIPSSAINAMSVGVPFGTLEKLRAMAQLPKYRQASLGFIKEPSR